MNQTTRAPGGRPQGVRNKPKAPAPTLPHTVPAPQYDRMRAPIWTATPAAPARPGALDHARIESRGYRC